MKVWATIARALEAHGSCAMVSVVKAEGSVPREEGARMVVTAEVYQSDMGKLKIGQEATITADGFQGSVRAVLYKVLPQVQKQSTFAGTPGENMDQRVYEVKLRLLPTPEQKKKLPFASNLQVNVVFDAAAPSAGPSPSAAQR